ILLQPDTFGNSVHAGVSGNAQTQVATGGNPAAGGSGLNLFADPDAVFKAFRPIQISRDTTSGGGGQLRGHNRSNLGLTPARKITVAERVNVLVSAQVFNVFNHVHFNDPSVSLQSPQTFGVISTQQNSPRVVALGLHFSF